MSFYDPNHKSRKSHCKICKVTLEWKNEGGKWIPYTLDGNKHYDLKPVPRGYTLAT